MVFPLVQLGTATWGVANTAITKSPPTKTAKEGDVATNTGKSSLGTEVQLYWEYDGKEWKEINKKKYEDKTKNYTYTTGNQDPEAESISKAVRYPRDLSIDVDSDYVIFEFFEYQPPFKGVKSKLDKTGGEIAADIFKALGGSGALGVPGYILSAGIKIEDKVNVDDNEYASRTLALYNQSNDDEKFYKKTSRNSIILYMPEDISTGYRASWSGKKFSNVAREALTTAGSDNFASFIENAAKSMASAKDKVIPNAANKTLRETISAITGESIGADDVFGATRGVVINPNVELLFSGHDLRNFTLKYKLVPRNADEAIDIKKIINTFRAAMLPNFADGDEITFSDSINVAQNFIKVPNVCKISFMTGGNLNSNVPQYKMCAMTQVDVNYTPDGTYATLEDGSMVAYELTISFQETKLIFSEEVEKY